MPDDKDKAVLATRVLSYLKRKFGNGPQPSAEETKAAIAAVTLFSTAYPTAANDPGKMFEKLQQVARKDHIDGNIFEQTEMDQMRLQMYMQKRQQMYEILSNIMKKQSDASKSIISNLR